MASGGDARLLKSTKFPPEFNQKVDMQKVNVQVVKKSVMPSPQLQLAKRIMLTCPACRWIAGRISEILGTEDDVVIELVFNLIEGARNPDIKLLQIQLTGFLEKDTPTFCKELWKLLLSAQASPQGVPKELLEAKKLELMQEKAEADRAAEDSRRRRDEQDRRDREIAELKERDRRDRRPPFQDTRGGRRGDRAFDRGGRGGGFRGRDRSWSPDDRYRHSRDPYGRDSYVPRGRGRGHDRGPQPICIRVGLIPLILPRTRRLAKQRALLPEEVKVGPPRQGFWKRERQSIRRAAQAVFELIILIERALELSKPEPEP
ncbi:PWI domain-containing protein-like protein [Hapsidospora chrysogenum ATCC 11550]|uniref:PWI domain-containing protein-like protein n=1 Tax=Hapsidospora chrysogenum (strain ATCC 11550 / CBS 779.69 / DSM 880 / IAM 14645 / JCM 23072 / IMI 49137) TaxID=857340 RepID=A0A086SYX8_HAPC1|nr:PWI domain-containing protein-like protein [Hapsidospora chrysogenum ATCC 11550]